jgi:hypothetical protein
MVALYLIEIYTTNRLVRKKIFANSVATSAVIKKSLTPADRSETDARLIGELSLM